MNDQQDLPWLVEARKYIGEKEIKGGQHNPLILQWWKDIKRGGIKDDETPWCAGFLGAMLEHVGIRSSRFESAKSYLEWGNLIGNAVYGCIVVFTRDGGGHVGFLVGKTKEGELLVLGGNQSDAVNVRAFAASRVAGYRWPVDYPVTTLPMPISTAERSNSEA